MSGLPLRWRLAGASASAGFAVRTTVAAQLALMSGAALGLHNSHWAAMTVWLVAQPTRGLLLEKSALRLFGTLVGAGVGFALLALCSDRQVPLVVGVALWGALCAGASAFVRPARAYGIILAGYTAIMLAVPASGPHSLHGLFADRVLCTVLGVLVSTAVTALFTPSHPPADLDDRLRRLGDEVFAFAHAVRTGTMGQSVLERQRRLVAEVGRTGEEAARALPGFFGDRRRRRQVRRALRALLGLLVESRVAAERTGATAPPPLAAPEPIPRSARGDRLAARIRAGAVRWRHVSTALAPLAPRLVGPAAAPHAPGGRSLGNHRDAAAATGKALAGMALVGAAWWATGWRDGLTMMVSASVFLTLFAANEHARTFVTHILVGSACGGVAAITFVLLLPLARTPAETALLAAPFLLAGAFAMARPTTAKAAIDFNMVFLLATPAPFTLTGDVAESASRALAIVVGVLAAALFFHATHETAPRRVRRLAHEVARGVRRVAGSDGAERAILRRGELADRVVRMAMVAELDARLATLTERAIDHLALGAALARLVALRDVAAVGPRPASPVASALEGASDPAAGPLELAASFEREAETLAGASGTPACERRAAAATSLRDAARLLRRAASRVDG